MENEEWRPVVGYEGLYEVSNLGRVKSFPQTLWISPSRKHPVGCWRPLAGRIMKPAGSGLQKRPMVGLHKNKTVKLKKVYHLVLEAFVGPMPEGMMACHNDGDVNNSALTNLRWDTRVANMADMKLHGTHVRGSKASFSKHTEEQIIEIRKRYASGGVSQRQLGKEYGMSQSDVSGVVRRTKWAWAEEDLAARNVQS